MADYVLYCFDGSKLLRCERFTAPNHEEAIRESLRRRGGQAAELWCGPERVRMFAKVAAAD